MPSICMIALVVLLTWSKRIFYALSFVVFDEGTNLSPFPACFFFFNQMYRKENCPHFFKNPSSSNPLEVLNHFFLLISLSCYIGWGTRVCWTLAAASSWVLTAPKSTEDWWWQVLPCEAGLPVFHRSKGRPGGGAMILITWWLWLQWRQPKATLGGWHL